MISRKDTCDYVLPLSYNSIPGHKDTYSYIQNISVTGKAFTYNYITLSVIQFNLTSDNYTP